MNNKLVLGICFAVGAFCAAPAIHAGQGQGKGAENRSAKASQIQIDKATGRKVIGSDSEAEISAPVRALSAATNSATNSAAMPTQSAVSVYHDNGTVSAQVGEQHMKYLVMTIDENGEKSFSHQSLKSAESSVATVNHNVEEK